MDVHVIQRAYRRYARGYDLYFGPVLQPGRRSVVEKMNCRPGERILEVGVGTGLSLPLYPSYVRVTGIDISRKMLSRARARRRKLQLANVEQLLFMDGEHMEFPDDSFDKVVAMYVATVTPDPPRLIAEMRRVCKPNGELFIVNHFRSHHPLARFLEQLVSPLSRLLGFRPDLSLEEFVARTRLDVAEKANVNMLGYWTLLRIRNRKFDTAGLHTPEPLLVARSLAAIPNL